MMLQTVKTFVSRYRLIEKNDRVLLAVSAGPDSMAMLHILNAWQEEGQFTIGAAYLNHQLRPEAEAEQEYLQTFCQAHQIPFYTRTVDVSAYARRGKKTLEEAGREQRYLFFKELCSQFDWQKIATAHHRDDRAETVLIHLLRGSGIKGLRSIMPFSGQLIRPMLAVSKVEILAYLKANAIQYFIDASNYDLNYLRNRVRHELLPLLQTYNPQIISSLNQLADIAAAEDQALETATESLWPQLMICQQADKIILDNAKLGQLALAYQRRLVLKALAALTSESGWGLSAVDYVLELAFKPGSGKRINLPQGVMVRKQYRELVFSLTESEGKSFCYEISMPGFVKVAETGATFSFTIIARENFQAADGETYFDYDKLTFPLFLRSRQAGDRFSPAYMQGSKKLKDYFIDIKLPAALRDQVPVLASQHEIYALLGYRLSSKALIDASTRTILAVKKVN